MKITNVQARTLACGPGKKESLFYETASPLGLRVTAAGSRSWFCEVWLRPTVTGGRGKSVRRAIGSVADLSADAARAAALRIAADLTAGRDALQQARAEKAQERADSLTLSDALGAYIKGKRRGKDGLALKARTTHDYKKMLLPGGALAGLASKSIHRISAEDIRAAYNKVAERSPHGAAAAMRCLRAVLNWHGVQVAGSPFDRATPGRDRIALPSSVGAPTPIPAERLHAWWAAACAMAGNVSADALRFQLVTGCRPGEIFGSKFALGLRVADVDLHGGRVFLRDTKNRTDHTIPLSHQALEIVQAHCRGKKSIDKVFDVLDPGKTLDIINAAAGITTVRISAHRLRHTFASVAAELVSGYALKRMMNHAGGADITGNHYVGHGEARLRSGWQAVADYISQPVEQGEEAEPAQLLKAA